MQLAAKHTMLTVSVPKVWRYFAFCVFKTKHDDWTQLSRLDFYTQNGDRFVVPSGTTYTLSSGSTGDAVNNILDGSVNTKMCIAYFDTVNGLVVKFDMQSKCLDTSVYNKWRWYTANDVELRDPVSFAVYFSVDGEKWYLGDNVVDATITSSRKALAYEGDIAIARTGGGYKRKCVRRSYRRSLRPSARFWKACPSLPWRRREVA